MDKLPTAIVSRWFQYNLGVAFITRLGAGLLIAQWSTATLVSAQDGYTIVREAIEYWRDQSSYTEADLTIHRPDWERTMSMRAWTKGNDRSLVRFTAPPKDAGNASLTVREEMWTFNPRINKVLKIPSSMMNQSWMGSDFSYADLSKDYKVVDDYVHRLEGSERQGGQIVYVVSSIPKENAPVVWGKEVFRIREDHVLLEREFYDQEMKLLKRLVASELAESGNKIYARRIRMTSLDNPGEWTEVWHRKVGFGLDIPDPLFSVANFSNPRD